MPTDNRAQRLSYGEVKRPRTIGLTDTAVAALDAVADELQITRAEVVERLARGGEIVFGMIKKVTSTE